MGRLIDADAIVEYVRKYSPISDGADLLETWLEYAPTVDAVPVRHGRWIEDPDDDWGYRCSECGHLELYQFDYCASCGARMDGKDGNDG